MLHPLLAAALLALASAAQARPSATLRIQDGWTRTAPPGAPVAGYLAITNRGPAGDQLLAASSPLARTVGLHQSTMRGAVVSMHAVPGGLAIPAGATVKLEPGGYHLMLTGLKRALRPGDRVALSLRFRRAGAVRTSLRVRGGPEPMHMP